MPDRDMWTDILLRRRVIALFGLILAAVLFLTAAVPVLARRGTHADTTEGLKVLSELAVKDPNIVDEKIRLMKKKELKEALEADTSSVWAYFDDAIIMGDSRVTGFYIFGFLPESRVLADTGATIRKIPEYMDRLIARNPARVFISFGMNDILIGFWDGPEAYAEELGERVRDIQTALPNTEVYIDSIMTVLETANLPASARQSIPHWNEVIRAYCEENDIHYIDCSEVLAANMHLFDLDGIHFKATFYEPWAVTMISEVVME